MKTYFKGGKGIKNPVDFDGKTIKEGDILTFDSFERDIDEEIAHYKKHYPSWTKEMIHDWKHKPCFRVKWNDKGYYYGEGIEEPKYEFSGRLYLHDFRFKYTKIVNEKIVK